MALTAQLNGWRGQAERLLTAHAGLGTKVGPATKRSARRSSSESGEGGAEAADGAPEAPPPETREIELERELESARSRIGGLERRLARETATNRALSEQVDTLAATAEDASKRANELEDEIAALRSSQEQADLPKLDELSELVAQKDATLKDAGDRIQFLEAALEAAERECARCDDEIAAANEKLHTETGAFGELIDSMSTRVVRAEKLLLNVQHYLLAHAAKNKAAEEKVSAAAVACREAQKENEQLRGLLHLTLTKIEQLERSHAALTADTEALLKAVAARGQGQVAVRQEATKVEDRCGGLQAKPQAQRGSGKGAENQRRDAGGNSGVDADWAELAELLTQLIERKRQSARPLRVPAGELLRRTGGSNHCCVENRARRG